MYLPHLSWPGCRRPWRIEYRLFSGLLSFPLCWHRFLFHFYNSPVIIGFRLSPSVSCCELENLHTTPLFQLLHNRAFTLSAPHVSAPMAPRYLSLHHRSCSSCRVRFYPPLVILVDFGMPIPSQSTFSRPTFPASFLISLACLIRISFLFSCSSSSSLAYLFYLNTCRRRWQRESLSEVSPIPLLYSCYLSLGRS